MPRRQANEGIFTRLFLNYVQFASAARSSGVQEGPAVSASGSGSRLSGSVGWSVGPSRPPPSVFIPYHVI